MNAILGSVRLLKPCLMCLAPLGVLLFLPSTGNAQGSVTAEVRSIIEGTWLLEEWSYDGQVLKPPVADGRFSLHDGVAIYMVHESSGPNGLDLYSYGHYVFGESTWAYQYDHFVTLTTTDSKLELSRDPFWPGTRQFTVSRDGSKVILDHENGRVRFVFEGDRFAIMENGVVQRKWKKVPRD